MNDIIWQIAVGALGGVLGVLTYRRWGVKSTIGWVIALAMAISWKLLNQ